MELPSVIFTEFCPSIIFSKHICYIESTMLPDLTPGVTPGFIRQGSAQHQEIIQKLKYTKPNLSRWNGIDCSWGTLFPTGGYLFGAPISKNH